MKRSLITPILIAICALSLAGESLAYTGTQRGGNIGTARGGHTLYGDLRIEGSKDELPQTYFLILYNESGRIFDRQPVANKGRYRFLNVANGEYSIVIEVENNEVARIKMVINERVNTDIRRDIEMQWRGLPVGGTKTGITSPAETYDRADANKSLFDKAQEAIRNNKNDEAISMLRQVVAADPKDFEAWTELGTAYFKEKKHGDAEKAYLSAIEQRPSYIVALLNLGKLRVSQKKYEAAIESLSQAVKAQPQSADANLWLGEAYLQIKKGSMAVGFLNEAIRLDPMGMAEVHLRLATLYNAAGLKDRAANEYELFLAKKPDYPDKKNLEKYVSEHKKP